jgi:phage anti-repressor protein
MISKDTEIFLRIETSHQITAYFIGVEKALNEIYLFKQVLKFNNST